MNALFRKKIEPRCVYCKHSLPMGEQEIVCKKSGIMKCLDHCRAFSYDPLKRVPPKAAKLASDYNDEDFTF